MLKNFRLNQKVQDELAEAIVLFITFAVLSASVVYIIKFIVS